VNSIDNYISDDFFNINAIDSETNYLGGTAFYNKNTSLAKFLRKRDF